MFELAQKSTIILCVIRVIGFFFIPITMTKKLCKYLKVLT